MPRTKIMKVLVLPTSEEVAFELPVGARFLDILLQDTRTLGHTPTLTAMEPQFPQLPVLYAEVDPEAPKEVRTLVMVSTANGHAQLEEMHYVKTVHLGEGRMCIHFYEK